MSSWGVRTHKPYGMLAPDSLRSCRSAKQGKFTSPLAKFTLSGSPLQQLQTKEKTPSCDEVFSLVEHLEKSSPLIIEEMHRWHDLLWEDYEEYKFQQREREKIHSP